MRTEPRRRTVPAVGGTDRTCDASGVVLAGQADDGVKSGEALVARDLGSCALPTPALARLPKVDVEGLRKAASMSSALQRRQAVMQRTREAALLEKIHALSARVARLEMRIGGAL